MLEREGMLENRERWRLESERDKKIRRAFEQWHILNNLRAESVIKIAISGSHCLFFPEFSCSTRGKIHQKIQAA